MTVEDPFAHLHDEAYADRFANRVATAKDMVVMGGRRRIPLDADWRFTPDLFDEGLRQEWFADLRMPNANWDKPRDYDPDGAATVSVPSCWTMERPEWRFFEGSAWYAKRFTWPPAMHGERLMLRVGAANYLARVFLNGSFLALHRGGSTPFFVELTNTLVPGDNELMIQVENRREADRVPMNHFDWFNHGGLHREVDLIPLQATIIRDVFARLVPGSGLQRIAVDITMSDESGGIATLRIPALGIETEIALANGKGRAEIACSPSLWSPDTPTLYDLEVHAGADIVRERIGFREIAVRGTDILLNGKKIYLRGVCVHEDDLLLGRVTNDADIRQRFAHAQEMGCNFIRLSHYPHHERVAEIADKLGVMLWAEIPVYWAIAFENPATLADASNQLDELIKRDRNRASIIIWGVGNENADTDARYRFMSTLAERARATDPTRLISAACLINRVTFAIEDRLAEHLDVIGINEYFGWYEPDFSGLETLLTNSHADRPVVISETGADALAGHHGGERELFTEECQAEYYRQQLAILSRFDWISGLCAWLLYDFRSERRQTRFQRGFNRKGLIAEDKRTKKMAFDVLAKAYGATREVPG
jgi:beta-glucuronidase